MPVTDARKFTAKVFIPGKTNVVGKIVITADDSTDYTLLDSYSGAVNSNYTIDASVTRVVTDKIGSFRVIISNDEGRFYNKFDGGEVIHFYADVTDATTLIFRGRVDNVMYGLDSSRGFYIELDGRDYPELIDKTITGIESAVKADISIGGILNEFYSDVTLEFWNGSSWSVGTYDENNDTVTWSPAVTNFPTTLINMSYQDKKGWSVISDVCKRAGLDCYMNYDTSNSRWTIRLLVKDAIQNTGAYITYGVNLLRMSEYGDDNTEIVNRVKAYGRQESDNIVLLKTEDDTTSQSNLWIKDRIINDADITTMDEVQDKANSELSLGTSLSTNGRFSAIGLYGISPGENIYCVIPYTGVNGFYRVVSFTHKFLDMFQTDVELEEKTKDLQDLFVEKENPDEIVSNINNLNAMDNSVVVYFDESPSKMTHSGTGEASGRLSLLSGQTTGLATLTDYVTTDNNVTECEFRRYENYSTINDVYEVTNDGGVNWHTYSTASGDILTFDSPNNKVAFRMTLNRTSTTAASPEYESVSLLYK